MTGGMETYAYEVATELAKRGHEVNVLTLKQNCDGQEENFRCLPLLYGHSYLDRETVANGKDKYDVTHVMNAAWSWVCSKEHPTFLSIHGNDFLSPNPVDGLCLKKRFNLPFGDNLDFRIANYRTPRKMRKHMKNTRKIFSNSEYTKKVFASVFPTLESKVEVGLLGLGQDFQDISPSIKKKHNRPIRLVSVCRLSESRKNIDGVIRALAYLKTEFDFTYHVIGDGVLKSELESLATSLNINDRITFHGRLRTEDLIRLLVGSDLFVLVPRLNKRSYEGFGIVYLEANACGIPVLATNQAGPAEAVKDGVSGYFSQSADCESIAQSLRRFFMFELSFDSTLCVSFAKSFSWAKLVDQFELAYVSVA